MPWTCEGVSNQGLYDVANIAVDVFERQVETGIEQYLLNGCAKAALGGVIDVIRRFLGIDKFG